MTEPTNILLKENDTLHAENARLTAFNVSLQDDSRLNTIKLREHEAANLISIKALKAQAAQINHLITELKRIALIANSELSDIETYTRSELPEPYQSIFDIQEIADNTISNLTLM